MKRKQVIVWTASLIVILAVAAWGTNAAQCVAPGDFATRCTHEVASFLSHWSP